MKPYILKNQEFLTFFNKLGKRTKLRLISNLNKEHINTISEVCKNFLKKNLTQEPRIIEKVKAARKEIRQVALKTTPLYKKKKILQSRKGGFILSVLLPLATTLISSLINK